MREPLDSERITIFIQGVLLFALTIIICSLVDRIRNIEIPYISDRDLIFWLIEFHEQ